MTRASFVVTGAAGGVGRGIARRLVADGAAVICLDLREPDPGDGLVAVVGSAGEQEHAADAVGRAESLAPCRGWVNNAAVFADADLADDPGGLLAAVEANLAPVLVGSAVAVRHWTSPVERAPSSTSPPIRLSAPCAVRWPTRQPRPRSRD